MKKDKIFFALNTLGIIFCMVLLLGDGLAASQDSVHLQRLVCYTQKRCQQWSPLGCPAVCADIYEAHVELGWDVYREGQVAQLEAELGREARSE